MAPNITAKYAYLCPRGSILKGVGVWNATIGSTNVAAQNSIVNLNGSCSDGTQLPPFSEKFGGDSMDTYKEVCLPLGFPDVYAYNYWDIPGQNMDLSLKLKLGVVPYRYVPKLYPSAVYAVLPLF